MAYARWLQPWYELVKSLLAATAAIMLAACSSSAEYRDESVVESGNQALRSGVPALGQPFAHVPFPGNPPVVPPGLGTNQMTFLSWRDIEQSGFSPGIPLPPTLGDFLDDLVRDTIAQGETDSIPPGPPSCGCMTFVIEPRMIPQGTDVFEPGERFRLVPLCDGSPVPEWFSATDFLASLAKSYFLSGINMQFTQYESTRPPVASVTNAGLLDAVSPGTADVIASMITIKPVKTGICLAYNLSGVDDVTVDCAPPNVWNGSACVGEADLSVTPVATPNTPVAPGDGVQFQFYVNNQGPGAATDVSASIDFTAGLSQPTLLVHGPGSGSVPCSVAALTGGGNLATCTVPRLEPGETATIEGSATTTVPGQEVAAVFVSAQPPENAQQQVDNYAEATWVVGSCDFFEDFSGDLSNWTPGPSHLDSFGISNGALFLDGRGHLTGPGGWGVMRLDVSLGTTFAAEWEATVTSYDYANFVLFAGAPWAFNASLGYPDNGYIAWLDIDETDAGSPVPLLDIWKRVGGVGVALVKDVPLPFTLARGVSFLWKLDKTPTSIEVSINGVAVASVSDSAFSSSDLKLGLSFGEDSEGFIDNVRITKTCP